MNPFSIFLLFTAKVYKNQNDCCYGRIKFRSQNFFLTFYVCKLWVLLLSSSFAQKSAPTRAGRQRDQFSERMVLCTPRWHTSLTERLLCGSPEWEKSWAYFRAVLKAPASHPNFYNKIYKFCKRELQTTTETQVKKGFL